MRNCSVCGSPLAQPKNWTRLSKWRRALPRRCRSCISVKHGLSRTRLYREWAAMKNRCGATKCSNPSAQKYYIDRGITVCPEWMEFIPFSQWAMQNGYADHLSLDRINSDDGYSPTNCRWVTMVENLRSRADRKLTMEDAREIRRRINNGERQARLVEQFGVNQSQISRIVTGRRWAEAAP